MKQFEFIDRELGLVCVYPNVRGKRVIARRYHNYIKLTVPHFLTELQIKETFDQLKPRITQLKSKPKIIFTPETKFDTFSFSLKIELNNSKSISYSLDQGVLTIVCPSSFKENPIQNKIQVIIEQTLRSEAKRIIPSKIKYLSQRYGFSFSSVSITKSRGRWGSCSSKKRINISYFCLLLPEYLLDFVILHELCHTIEMNHGDQFWKLLDQVTNMQSNRLTKELNRRVIPF